MKPIAYLVMQPKGSNLCGQACVAMICDITLEDAIKQVGKKGGTKTKDLTRVINKVFPVSNRLTKINSIEDIPYDALLKVTWLNKRSHWVLNNNNIIYDPYFGCLPLAEYLQTIKGRITSYLHLNQ